MCLVLRGYSELIRMYRKTRGCMMLGLGRSCLLNKLGILLRGNVAEDGFVQGNLYEALGEKRGKRKK